MDMLFAAIMYIFVFLQIVGFTCNWAVIACSKQRTEVAPRVEAPARDSSRGSGRSGSSRASPGVEPRTEGTARPQAGWGGEPLVTNGTLGEGVVSGPLGDDAYSDISIVFGGLANAFTIARLLIRAS